MAMKRCPYCRSENPDGEVFCVECNTRLLNSLASDPEAVSAVPQIVVKPKRNEMAFAAVFLGLISIFFSVFTGLPGLIMGIISVVQINMSGGRQKGMGWAITGIILSVLLPAFSYPMFFHNCGASRKAKDSTLRANVAILRSALETYQSDCGGSPADLDGLIRAGQYYPKGSSTLADLPDGVYKGPYLNAQGGIGGGSIPRNPYVTTAVVTDHWTYSGTSATVTFPSPTGNDANGDAYSGY